MRKWNRAVVGKVLVESESRFKPSFLSSQCCPYNCLYIKFSVLWSSIQHMFIVCYVPVTLVGSGYPAVTQARLCPHGAYVVVGGR